MLNDIQLFIFFVDNSFIFYQIVLMGFNLFSGGLIKIFSIEKNLLLIMLGIEVMMLGLIFIVLGSFNSFFLISTFNYSLVFVILTLVVAESVIGLVLILLLSKLLGSINLFKLSKLKG
jgi:NADH:ubiquinone oxidoreductase subunit K